MTRRVSLVLALCAALLGACGGDDTRATDEPVATSQAPPATPHSALALPSNVPLRSTRDGDPAAIKVIRLWTEALRRSDIARASALWAVPSKAQNGTPVLTLTTPEDVRLFNRSLSCGSLLVSARGARDGFTIAAFKLTGRPGVDCGTGVGNRARTAILVRDGRIAEWYRLPDDPDAPVPEPDAPPEPQEPGAPVI